MPLFKKGLSNKVYFVGEGWNSYFGNCFPPFPIPPEPNGCKKRRWWMVVCFFVSTKLHKIKGKLSNPTICILFHNQLWEWPAKFYCIAVSLSISTISPPPTPPLVIMSYLDNPVVHVNCENKLFRNKIAHAGSLVIFSSDQMLFLFTPLRAITSFIDSS